MKTTKIINTRTGKGLTNEAKKIVLNAINEGRMSSDEIRELSEHTKVDKINSDERNYALHYCEIEILETREISRDGIYENYTTSFVWSFLQTEEDGSHSVSIMSETVEDNARFTCFEGYNSIDDSIKQDFISEFCIEEDED